MGLFDSEEKLKAITAVVSLAALFTVHAIQNYETPVQIARRPAVVEVLRNRSRRSCPETDDPDAEQNHDARFAEVMEATHVQDLETYVEKGTTICLDSRLADQKTGIFDRAAIGVYYPEANTVSLYDNGHDTGGFLTTGSSSYAETMLEILADKIRDNEVPTDQVSIAGRYSYRCGKSTCYETRWKSAEDFDQDTQAKNPQLAHPPVRAAAERPEAQF